MRLTYNMYMSIYRKDLIFLFYCGNLAVLRSYA